MSETNNFINHFEVSNFKKFDHLVVKDIGQFNLITGDNNVGKTCLLEALLFNEDKLKLIISVNYNLLAKRGLVDSFIDNVNSIINIDSNYRENEFAFISRLNGKPIEFIFNNRKIDILNLRHKVGHDISGEYYEFINKVKLFEYKENNLNSENWIVFKLDDEITYLSDLTSKYYYELKHMYDVMPALMIPDDISYYSQVREELILNNVESIIEELNILFNLSITYLTIKNFSKDSRIYETDILIKTESRNELHSIFNYGEGLKRVLHVLFMLFVADSNKVVIDEIDTGIHYTKLKMFWVQILKICYKFNIQLFATTHSQECIEAYAQALEELGLEGDGRLINLKEEYNQIKAYSYPYPEFDHLIDLNTELR
jgi:AAA15 family ATPase/GTPase